jgi:hypothetical protein
VLGPKRPNTGHLNGLEKFLRPPKGGKLKKNDQNGTNTWNKTSKKSTCGLFTYIAFTEL